jgi:hypothetical protein
VLPGLVKRHNFALNNIWRLELLVPFESTTITRLSSPLDLAEEHKDGTDATMIDTVVLGRD